MKVEDSPTLRWTSSIGAPSGISNSAAVSCGTADAATSRGPSTRAASSLRSSPTTTSYKRELGRDAQQSRFCAVGIVAPHRRRGGPPSRSTRRSDLLEKALEVLEKSAQRAEQRQHRTRTNSPTRWACVRSVAGHGDEELADLDRARRCSRRSARPCSGPTKDKHSGSTMKRSRAAVQALVGEQLTDILQGSFVRPTRHRSQTYQKSLMLSRARRRRTTGRSRAPRWATRHRCRPPAAGPGRTAADIRRQGRAGCSRPRGRYLAARRVRPGHAKARRGGERRKTRHRSGRCTIRVTQKLMAH